MTDRNAERTASTVRRSRVVIGAYACGLGDESEANAGWAFTAAAAAGHDVWLITRPRFRAAIEAAVAADPGLAEHLTVCYLDLSERVLARKKSARDVYWYYVLWQRSLGRLAERLHAEVGFDVAHHVTFAVDWLPCGLQRLTDRVPLVWGPVGGATYTPWQLARWFGPRALAGEVLRGAFTRLARRVFADPVARRATIVVAQNPDVADRFRYARMVVTEPNCALPEAAFCRRIHEDSGKRAIFVGRLVAWKGPRMAVAAMADPAVADWTLDIFGAGRETTALKKAIADLGLDHRVRLLGQRPRSEVLAAFAKADAMLFPSMHDSAGWAVAEASAAGCPVVCLDKGGPALLAGPNGYVVASGKNVVANLADALRRAGEADRTPYDRWSRSRLPALVAEWYTDAMTTRA